ncbi:MAG: c-type cytochrome [Nitrospirae bacterium]|nr:c-type cytochrome [Nitrospirota bacterium]MCL4474602.1 c-type cytochrome [Nitrospirota bacterium]MCL5422546.1 c-type cytochrome [Nitrospirota bacterium]
MQENYDDIKEQHNKLPLGMFLFFIGMALWGIYYIASYTPAVSGWSQRKVYDEQVAKEKAVAKPVLTENPYEHDPKAIAEGKVLYASNCSACHGEHLKGGVGADLTGHLKYGETDDKKFESIAKGRPNGMPSFEQQLGRDRIWKVLAYVDSVREYGQKP